MQNRVFRYIGILNITPDSFSDGGKYLSLNNALLQTKYLFDSGVSIVDVGAESTKPQAKAVSEKEEWARLELILPELLRRYPKRISLDTQKFNIAKKFCQLGGTIINNVSGFQDIKMRYLALKYNTINIVNHFPGKSIFEVHKKKIDSVFQVIQELLQTKETLMNFGILPQNIILDPGIGFGKTNELNWKLLSFAKFLPFERILIGHSQKSFLGKYRFEQICNRIAGKIAIDSGAEFLRIHNPKIYQ